MQAYLDFYRHVIEWFSQFVVKSFNEWLPVTILVIGCLFTCLLITIFVMMLQRLTGR